MEENIKQKRELIAAISDLFLRFGLRSTSMDDIANHLKISKKTLYQQFANKDDVVEQVMLYRRDEKIKNTDVNQLAKKNPIVVMSEIREEISPGRVRKSCQARRGVNEEVSRGITG